MAFQLVPNVKHRLGKELKSLGLAPKLKIEDAIRQRLRWYTTPCRDKQKNQYLFKGVMNFPERHKMLHEIQINRFLKKQKLYSKINTQKLIKTKTQKYTTWILLEFLPGDVAGMFFDFARGAQHPKYIGGYVKNIIELQKIKLSKPKKQFPYIKIKTSDFYLHELNGFEQDILLTLSKDLYKKALAKLKEKKEVLGRHLVLTHGDTALSNFILGKNKIIYIFDWEQAHLNNPAFDVGFLWTQAWKNPSWRFQMLQLYMEACPQKKIFQKTFPLMIIYFSLREIALWNRTQRDRFRHVITGKTAKRFDPKKIQNTAALRAHKTSLQTALRAPKKLFSIKL